MVNELIDMLEEFVENDGDCSYVSVEEKEASFHIIEARALIEKFRALGTGPVCIVLGPDGRFVEAEVEGISVSLERRQRPDGLEELIVPLMPAPELRKCGACDGKGYRVAPLDVVLTCPHCKGEES